MKWIRLVDRWLVASVLLLVALLVLLACNPVPPITPRLPTVVPSVTFRPVCTRTNGLMGWTASLRYSGQYRVKLFNGPYPPIVDYSWPRKAPFTPGGDPNQIYVQTTTLPWVLEYLHGAVWVEASDRITTRPPIPCST